MERHTAASVAKAIFLNMGILPFFAAVLRGSFCDIFAIKWYNVIGYIAESEGGYE